MSFTLFIAITVGFLYPTYIILTHRKTNLRLTRNKEYRIIEYKTTISILWVFTLLVLLNNYLTKTQAIKVVPTNSIISSVLFILFSAFLLIQFNTMKVGHDTHGAIKEKLKNIYHYLPKTK